MAAQNGVNTKPQAYITTLIPNGSDPSGMLSKPTLPQPDGQLPLVASQAHLPGQLHTTYGCKHMQHQRIGLCEIEKDGNDKVEDMEQWFRLV